MDEHDVVEKESVRGESARGRHVCDDRVIEVGNGQLEFRRVTLADPVPTGRQIIEAAGLRSVEEHLVFAVAYDRRLTELSLEQTIDIRRNPTLRFLVFRSDRSWRGLIDGWRFEWGEREIFGTVLKWLAGVDAATHGVWLELRDEPDRLIGDVETASLAAEGVERFRTAPLFRVCIEDETHSLPHSTITTEQIAALGGWDVSEGVIEVDDDQNERTLKLGEAVELRPNISFGKKLRFKRG